MAKKNIDGPSEISVSPSSVIAITQSITVNTLSLRMLDDCVRVFLQMSTETLIQVLPLSTSPTAFSINLIPLLRVNSLFYVSLFPVWGKMTSFFLSYSLYYVKIRW